jgi:hypothetical protein
MPAAADDVLKLRFVELLPFVVVDGSRNPLDQTDLCKAGGIDDAVDKRAADQPFVLVVSGVLVEHERCPFVDLDVEQHHAWRLWFDGPFVIVRQLDAARRLRGACELA